MFIEWKSSVGGDFPVIDLWGLSPNENYSKLVPFYFINVLNL